MSVTMTYRINLNFKEIFMMEQIHLTCIDDNNDSNSSREDCKSSYIISK